MYKFGSTQQKILLTLMGGIVLGFSSSPKRYFKTFLQIKKEWQKIDQRNFNRSVHSLSREKLIEEKMMPDGSFKLILTKNGEKQARRMELLGRSIDFKKPKRWDRKWRVVLFDIPEKDRLFRTILREHLYTLKFYKMQQSVFVSPFPFEKAILELVALYNAEAYVRVITAEKIDNESRLKKHFSSLI